MSIIPRLLELSKDQDRRTRPITHLEQFRGLFQDMRARCPKPGDDYEKVWMVVLPHDEPFGYHDHPEHVVLYYVRPTSPIIVDGVEHHMSPGDFFYLPPNTVHFVPNNPSQEPRVSVAMFVEA